MFETVASDDWQEVSMDEGADVLEAMLPFCYPASVPALDNRTDVFWKLVKAFDKYSVSEHFCVVPQPWLTYSTGDTDWAGDGCRRARLRVSAPS